MPVKRRVGKGRRPEVSNVAWALLNDEPVDHAHWEVFYLCDHEPATSNTAPNLRSLWVELGAQITSDWAVMHPGTRPSCWWNWTAPRQPIGTYPNAYYDGKLPQPRQRLGGTGTPLFEAMAVIPSFHLGIPQGWVDAWSVAYFNGRARDIHGRSIGTKYVDGQFCGLAPDPHDLPVFEAQATYLTRLGLLLPDEARRLTKIDFASEMLAAAAWRGDQHDASPRDGGDAGFGSFPNQPSNRHMA